MCIKPRRGFIDGVNQDAAKTDMLGGHPDMRNRVTQQGLAESLTLVPEINGETAQEGDWNWIGDIARDRPGSFTNGNAAGRQAVEADDLKLFGGQHERSRRAIGVI